MVDRCLTCGFQLPNDATIDVLIVTEKAKFKGQIVLQSLMSVKEIVRIAKVAVDLGDCTDKVDWWGTAYAQGPA